MGEAGTSAQNQKNKYQQYGSFKVDSVHSLFHTIQG